MLYKPFTKLQILDSSKLKGFAEDNSKFNEEGRKFSKRVENTVGKEAISPFPKVFLKDLYCRPIKTRTCLAKGYTKASYISVINYSNQNII